MTHSFKSQLLNSCEPKALNAKEGLDIHLSPIGEHHQSSAFLYWKQQGEKEIDFSKALKEEVIDFIVNSFQMTQEDADLKERLRLGLKALNQRSKTARQMISQIPYSLSVLSVYNPDISSFAFVMAGSDAVYLNRGFTDKKNDMGFAIDFLHEIGHVLDNYQIRPLEGFNTGYLDEALNPISGGLSEKIGVKNSYKQDLVFEAEKQAISYQIEGETMRFDQKFLISLLAMSEGYLSGFGYKSKNVLKGKIALLNWFGGIKNYAKEVLKNPSALFSKKKREALSIRAQKRQMASVIKFLTQPVKKQGFFDKLKPSLAILGFFSAVVLSPSVPFMVLAGGACLGICGAHNLKQVNADFQRNWKKAYYHQALSHASHFIEKDSPDQQAFLLISKALEDKYAGFLSPKEIAKTELTDEIYTELMEPQLFYQKLNKETKEDLLLFANIFRVGQQEGIAADASDENVLLALMPGVMEVANSFNSLLTKENIDPKEASYAYLLSFIQEEEEALVEGLKKTSLNQLSKIHHKELRNKLLILKNKTAQGTALFKEKEYQNDQQKQLIEKAAAKAIAR